MYMYMYVFVVVVGVGEVRSGVYKQGQNTYTYYTHNTSNKTQHELFILIVVMVCAAQLWAARPRLLCNNAHNKVKVYDLGVNVAARTKLL